MLVAPSVLSADFGRLNEEILAICDTDCDYIHVDVMDGHFVPNMTLGPVVVQSIAKLATKPLDIHLMVDNNDFFVDLFVPLKPEIISFHLESEKHPHRLIQKIKSLGIKAGIVLNPHTSEQSLKYLLQDLDLVLLMSVNPGFGGQRFIKNVLQKAKNLKELEKIEGAKCLIEVDGGVNENNIKSLKEAGVDIVVAGTYVFSSFDYKKAVNSLK